MSTFDFALPLSPSPADKDCPPSSAVKEAPEQQAQDTGAVSADGAAASESPTTPEQQAAAEVAAKDRPIAGAERSASGDGSQDGQSSTRGYGLDVVGRRMQPHSIERADPSSAESSSSPDGQLRLHQQQHDGGAAAYGAATSAAFANGGWTPQHQHHHHQQQVLAKPPASRTNVYIAWLPRAFDENDLLNLVAPFGQIESHRLVHDPSRSYAFVMYDTRAAAEHALAALNATRVNGRRLQARISVAHDGGRTPQQQGQQGHPHQFLPQQQQPVMAVMGSHHVMMAQQGAAPLHHHHAQTFYPQQQQQQQQQQPVFQQQFRQAPPYQPPYIAAAAPTAAQPMFQHAPQQYSQLPQPPQQWTPFPAVFAPPPHTTTAGNALPPQQQQQQPQQPQYVLVPVAGPDGQQTTQLMEIVGGSNSEGLMLRPVAAQPVTASQQPSQSQQRQPQQVVQNDSGSNNVWSHANWIS